MELRHFASASTPCWPLWGRAAEGWQPALHAVPYVALAAALAALQGQQALDHHGQGRREAQVSGHRKFQEPGAWQTPLSVTDRLTGLGFSGFVRSLAYPETWTNPRLSQGFSFVCGKGLHRLTTRSCKNKRFTEFYVSSKQLKTLQPPTKKGFLPLCVELPWRNRDSQTTREHIWTKKKLQTWHEIPEPIEQKQFHQKAEFEWVWAPIQPRCTTRM